MFQTVAGERSKKDDFCLILFRIDEYLRWDVNSPQRFRLRHYNVKAHIFSFLVLLD